MSRPGVPERDIEAGERIVRALLRAQAPHLAHLPLRRGPSGWDTQIHRLGDHLAVRVPRRRSAAGTIEHEQRWLPLLAPRLGVRVPVPLLAGAPTAEFPWPWSVTPWFEGVPAAALLRRGGLPARIADEVSGVLLALHRPAPAGAPRNPYRGGPLQERRDAVAARLDPPLRDTWAQWSAAEPWNGPALWIHGDLHPLNLVVDDGALAAVIDFGDLTAGDPAYDLAIAWLAFEEPERERFRRRIDRATGHSPATWLRARAFALAMADLFRATGEPGSDAAAIGEFGLRQLL